MTDLHEILTGNEDPSLWWITYVEQMVSEYSREHAWRLDDNPQTTHEAISVVKDGCTQLRNYLQEIEEEKLRCRIEESPEPNLVKEAPETIDLSSDDIQF